MNTQELARSFQHGGYIMDYSDINGVRHQIAIKHRPSTTEEEIDFVERTLTSPTIGNRLAKLQENIPDMYLVIRTRVRRDNGQVISDTLPFSDQLEDRLSDPGWHYAMQGASAKRR